MKSAEEKSRFKSHFFSLGQGRIISLDRHDYWATYWKFPSCSNDVFELLTPSDIVTIRNQNLANFLSLIRVISTKLIELRHAPNFPFTSSTTTKETLNCIRLLTKLLPFLYELPNYTSELEQVVFWNEYNDPVEFATEKRSGVKDEKKSNEKIDKSKIFACNLLQTTIDLLFIKGFTLDAPKSTKGQSPNSDGRSLSVWEPGIGTSSSYQTPNLIIDSNRAQVLRFLLTLTSTSFYISPSQLISNGCKFLTLLVTSTPRVELLTLICSLFNLVCRSARTSPNENALHYNNPQLTKTRHLCVTYSIQLLAAMVVYPLPSNAQTQFLIDLDLISSPKPYNMARLYIGKLHKESEILYLASYFVNILRSPLDKAKDFENSKFALSIKANQPSLWSIECIILLWELFQCNKSFKTLAGSRYISELIVLLLFHIHCFQDNNAHKNTVRVASYFLLYLSADESLMKHAVKPINSSFYENLPSSFKVNPRPITTRDFIVIHICQMLSSSIPVPSGPPQTKKQSSDLLSATLVEILYNLVPFVDNDLESTDVPLRKLSNTNPGGGLSYTAASALTQLITKFSTRQFLTEASFHTDLLALVFRAICTAVVKYPKASRMLLFCILKNEKTYDLVWNTIFNLNAYPDHKLNSIDDEDEEQEESSFSANDGESFDLSFGDNLSRVESHRSDQLSITPSLPKNDIELTESEFIQSLSAPPSSRNSISSLPGTPVPESKEKFSSIEEIDPEIEAIDAALRPKPPTGMSQKVREKLPKNSSLQKSWGGNDALRIILTIIIPHLKIELKDIWSGRQGSTVDSFLLIKHIEAMDFQALFDEYKSQINYDFLPNTPLELLKFKWSHLSLGWYTSILYGRIFNSIENVTSFVGGDGNIMRNLSSSLASFSKITSGWSNLTKPSSNDFNNDSPEVTSWVHDSLTNVNNWSYTSIKLFKIEFVQKDSFFPIDTKNFGFSGNNSAPGTPGGVNDMANSLVRRFSDFRVNNASRNSLSSLHSGNSILNTPIEEQESAFGKYTPRNSVTSLQSLNAINRSRTNTPRNSISM